MRSASFHVQFPTNWLWQNNHIIETEEEKKKWYEEGRLH